MHLHRRDALFATERSRSQSAISSTIASVTTLSLTDSTGAATVQHSRNISQTASENSQFPFPRSPNSSGSSASSTKRLTASPPPKPTPKRTSKTPAPSSKATSNPSSPSAARGGWRRRLANCATCHSGHRLSRQSSEDDLMGFRVYRAQERQDGYLQIDSMKFIDQPKSTRWIDVELSCQDGDDVLFASEASVANVASC